MDIVSRIKNFLTTNDIASSQFADRCEIPRPTISQLLNGRNKKVSDELISKIHTAYPDLSIMWLMFGEGDMNNLKEPANLKSDELLDNLASENINSMGKYQVDEKYENLNASKIECNQPNIDITHSLLGNIETTQKPSYSSEYFTQKNEKSRENIENGDLSTINRTITNILVFYSDNSFESYKPSK